MFYKKVGACTVLSTSMLCALFKTIIFGKKIALGKIIFIILKTLSYLPFWVLYGISDVLFVLNYYIIGYRKKLVMDNLNIAFPEKSLDEKKKISRVFFRNFTDFIVESIKTFSMSKESFEKRYRFENIEEIKEYLIKDNRGAVISAAHQFNWEWMIYVGSRLSGNLKAFISYTPLSNKVLDSLIRKNRERFGLTLTSASQFINTLGKADENILPVSGLISDQSPKANYKFRAEFFGVEVPVYTGPENIARKLNQSFWFLNVKKAKRGHYLVYFELIAPDVSTYKEGELTKISLRKTEELIRAQPENYLWTHRRWKHRV